MYEKIMNKIAKKEWASLNECRQYCKKQFDRGLLTCSEYEDMLATSWYYYTDILDI